ncbi:hypothetical protein BCN_1645 [Bacillus cereus NC7401]|nr:hypothetical protein BCN_1645 [Bacillus cereus NC7401]
MYYWLVPFYCFILCIGRKMERFWSVCGCMYEKSSFEDF